MEKTKKYWRPKWKAIKNYKTRGIKGVIDFINEPLSPEQNALINEIDSIEENVNYRKLKFTGGNRVVYDFSDYELFTELYRDIYNRNMSIIKVDRK